MSFDLIHILGKMDVFQWIIVGTLMLMAISTLAVFLERLWSLRRARQRSREYAALAAAHLTAQETESLSRPDDRQKGAPLARILTAGAAGFERARRDGTDRIEAVELAGKAVSRARESVQAELQRGMNVLASVGSVSPFVGLLGTVVGIIAAFQGIAKEGSGGLGAVSGGIAEALVVTAFGLCVAIPAVLAFNLLTSRVDSLLLALDQGAGELLDHLQRGAARRSVSAGGETRAA